MYTFLRGNFAFELGWVRLGDKWERYSKIKDTQIVLT